jgi:selenocysteine lyase/cysteine desulfurase
MDLTTAAQQFSPTRIHADSASVGLAPQVCVDALNRAITDWQSGEVAAPDYDVAVARARDAYATIAGCPVDWLAITTPVSVATAHAAALLQPGQTVLVAEEEFTSLLFPFLIREGDGIVVRPVPVRNLIDNIDPSVEMVAVSAVQSADGYRIDLDVLVDKAKAAGALTYIDVTQAAGWLPLDVERFDMTAVGAYKWLCCPRGSGFFSVAPHLWDRLNALAPGWYSGQDPWTSTYRPPFRQADNARRYDVSPAWLCWEGAAASLEFLAQFDPAEIGGYNITLANRFRAGLGLEPSNSAIVPTDLTPPQVEAVEAAKVNFASRDGRSRFSFHLYNTEVEVDTVINTITAAST